MSDETIIHRKSLYNTAIYVSQDGVLNTKRNLFQKRKQPGDEPRVANVFQQIKRGLCSLGIILLTDISCQLCNPHCQLPRFLFTISHNPVNYQTKAP